MRPQLRPTHSKPPLHQQPLHLILKNRQLLRTHLGTLATAQDMTPKRRPAWKPLGQYIPVQNHLRKIGRVARDKRGRVENVPDEIPHARNVRGRTHGEDP